MTEVPPHSFCFAYTGNVNDSVVVCTDFSGKEPHRQLSMGMVVTSGILGGVMVSVIVYTDLSGKEPHRQVGVGSIVISGILGGVMVSTLAWNARDVGSIPGVDLLDQALYKCFIIISHFHHPHDTGTAIFIQYFTNNYSNTAHCILLCTIETGYLLGFIS